MTRLHLWNPFDWIQVLVLTMFKPAYLDNFQADDATRIRAWLFSAILLSPMLIINNAVIMGYLDSGYLTEVEYKLLPVPMILLVILFFLISFCVTTDDYHTHSLRLVITSVVLGIMVVYWYLGIYAEVSSVFVNARAHHFTKPLAISLGCLIALITPIVVSSVMAPNKTGKVILLVFNGLVFMGVLYIEHFALLWLFLDIVEFGDPEAVNRFISIIFALLVVAYPGVFQLLIRRKLSSISGLILLMLLAASLSITIRMAYLGGWDDLSREMLNSYELLRQQRLN